MTNRIASHPERGRRLGDSDKWAAVSRVTEPEVVIYYQFNEDYVYLIGIKAR